MPPLTLAEMLRLGGIPTYISALAGVIIIALTVMGYAAVAPRARRQPAAAFPRGWSWAILICGLVCAFNGGAGTITGLMNVNTPAGAAGAAAADLTAYGAFEVLFNVAFSFMFAWLALFGYASTKLIAGRGL
jgi:hypothetical protein